MNKIFLSNSWLNAILVDWLAIQLSLELLAYYI